MSNKRAPGVGPATLPKGQLEETSSKNCSTSFTIVKQDCPHWDDCESPLCPLDATSLEFGIWFGDEAICRAKHYQSLDWVKAQKRIAKLRLGADDGFFNVAMLAAVKQPRPGLKGLNPDMEIGQSKNAEKRWIAQKGPRVSYGKIPKGGQVTRAKRDNVGKVPVYAASGGRGQK